MTSQDMETRLTNVERAQADLHQIARDLRDLGKRQADAVEKLVRLEERHQEQREAMNRAFNEIETHSRELEDIKIALPPLQETRRWIMTGIIGLVSMVLIALVGLVVVKPAAMTVPVQQSVIK